MAADVFLTTTDLRDLVPVAVGDQGPLDHQQALMLLASKRPDLAEFFAEPVFTRDDDGTFVSASWYVSVDREARRLNQLQPARRERVEAVLESNLAALREAASDPDLAAIVPAMSVIPNEEDLYAIGTSPVVVNWGLTDKGNVGSIGPGMAVGALAAYMAAPTPGDGTGDAAETMVDSAQDVGVDSEGTHGETTSATVSSEADGAAAPGVAAPLVVTAAAEEPFHQRPWFRYLVYGALILLILWLLWLLFRSHIDARLNPPPSATALHAPVLRGLTDERDRLQGLLQDPCSPDALQTARRGPAVGTITPGVPTEPVPGAPGIDGGLTPQSQTPGQPEDRAQSANGESANQPIPLSELARRLESSVAFILAVGDKDAGSGSGFFISNDTVVTNSHVVEKAKKVYVTSKHLGLVREANVVVKTPDARPGKRDYAILKLVKPADSIRPLQLSNELHKGDRVVAVGYPGALTRHDAQRKALLKGDMNASPEAVFTYGLVNVIYHDNQPVYTAHSADISQGNSGGPLVDECNRVVGINTFISQDRQSGRRSKFSLVGSDIIAYLKEKGVPFRAATGQCGGQTAQAAPQADSGGGPTGGSDPTPESE